MQKYYFLCLNFQLFKKQLYQAALAVVTGIWSEIPEILCVEITDELLRTTGHMNNSCLREFVFAFSTQ